MENRIYVAAVALMSALLFALIFFWPAGDKPAVETIVEATGANPPASQTAAPAGGQGIDPPVPTPPNVIDMTQSEAAPVPVQPRPMSPHSAEVVDISKL